MKKTIEKSKEAYWKVRSKSEKAWSDAMKIVKKSEQCKSLQIHLTKLNQQRRHRLSYYLCTYEIHPNDVDKVNFTDDFRGSYIDCMQRCNHFTGSVVSESDDEFPFPLPNKPIKVIVCCGHDEDFGLGVRFIDLACINCGMSSKLPFGYYCDNCIEPRQKIYRNDEFDVQAIADIILRIFERQIRDFTGMISDSMIETCIEAEDIYAQEDDTAPYDESIRLILTNIILMNVCIDEHDYSDDGYSCKKCDMLFIE